MRFITEFELLSKFEIEKYKTMRQGGAAEWLGLDIAQTFGWQIKGQTPLYERHALEIEAFPMDKWIEFKDDLIYELRQPHADMDAVLKLIKKIESFGKP